MDAVTRGESWRIFRIMGEFVDAVDMLDDLGSCRQHFRLCRVEPDDPIYQKAEELAALFAKNSFAVITGGGGGIMEAANKGAAEAGGKSVGLNYYPAV